MVQLTELMIVELTELIIEIPRPASISGIALFKDELKLLTLPTESLNINEKVSIGFLMLLFIYVICVILIYFFVIQTTTKSSPYAKFIRFSFSSFSINS